MNKSVLIIYVLFFIFNAKAQNNYHELCRYLSSNGQKIHSSESVSFLKKRSETGDTIALYHLANAYTGYPYKQKKKKKLLCDSVYAASLYKSSADKGFSLAQLEYAKCLAFGYGIKKDLCMAYHYFHLASEQNNTTAMIYEGDCLRRGLGCEVDLHKAFQIYKKAFLIQYQSDFSIIEYGNKENIRFRKGLDSLDNDIVALHYINTGIDSLMKRGIEMLNMSETSGECVFVLALTYFKKDMMMEALNLMREIAFPADYKLCRYYKFKDL